MWVDGVIALIIAYLLGSIPAAYIVTRLRTGKDVRQVGGGNVGARNVFVEVGKVAGIAVGIFDVAKGAAAVAIACWLLGSPPLSLLDTPLYFVLAAGVAVVAGHIWSIYLKFTGGNGIATTLGVLSLLVTRELLIALAITLVFIVVTRNPVLSMNISLFSVPVSARFLQEPWLPYVIFSIVVALVLVLNFLPTFRAGLAEAGSKENFVAELLRRDKARQE